jgi:hypothetical protein
MEYIKRIVDSEMLAKLNVSGAILIRGVKEPASVTRVQMASM